jgi:hypothetical protein
LDVEEKKRREFVDDFKETISNSFSRFLPDVDVVDKEV